MNSELKILVVDDDQVDRLAVRRFLKVADFRVELVEVDDCASALETLHAQSFDLIFIDFRLPDGDGLSLIQKVQQAGIQTPVVVLTGQGDEQTAVQLIKAGASDYLLKERISTDTLAQIVRNTIRLHQAELEAKQVAQKLRDSEERYRLVVEGSGAGIWDWDILNDRLYWNDPLLEIVGLGRPLFGNTFQAFVDLVHPADWPRVQRAIQAHLDHNVAYNEEFRLRHSSGSYRHCIVRGKAQRNERGAPVRMAGILTDITDRKLARQAVAESEERFRTMADSAPVLLWLVDPQGQRCFFNQAWLDFTGCNLKQELRDGWLANLHPEDQQTYLRAYFSAFQVHRPFETEYRLRRFDGEYRWILATDTPRFLPDGGFAGYIGSGIDITERKRSEEAQRFLAEASSVLATSLDYQVILENLARMTVPYLADYCIVDILQDDQSLQQVAVAHLQPAKAELVQELRRRHPFDPELDYGVARVLKTGQPEMETHITEEVLEGYAQDAEHLRQLRELGPKSYIVVPLTARERILGAISFIFSESGRTYTAANLTVAEDLARRAALAVDNARLYRKAQEIGDNLRRAIIVLGEQQQQLRALQQLTNLLNQRLTDLPGLLQLMVEAVCNAIPKAEFGLIALYNRERNSLELTAATGTDNLSGASWFDIQEGVFGQVFATGESQLIHNQVAEPLNPATRVASCCVVPIQSVQAGRFGILAVGNWTNSQAFNEEERILMIAFGEQAAIALSNAQLINALEEREARLATQNEILAQQNRELEHQRQQIQLQNLKLIEATQLKSQFLATMSHELRTPMNAITGFSQLLLRQRHNGLDPKQVDMVERILNNGKNLLTLINDILDLSKIEAGRMELNLENFDLQQLISETVAELQSLADQKGLNLQVQGGLKNPQIHNDRLRLRQILVNLISNAIKFTETGGITLYLQEPQTDQIEIQVQDTGIGIDKNHLRHIFNEFWQADQTTTRRHAGTGLGLAITARLLRMMSGNISVESEVGRGSTFRIQFPRQVALLPSNFLL